jgi:hypothetical protein
MSLSLLGFMRARHCGNERSREADRVTVQVQHRND